MIYDWSREPEHLTDEEIRDRADYEANRADHDNQCGKDLEDDRANPRVEFTMIQNDQTQP